MQLTPIDSQAPTLNPSNVVSVCNNGSTSSPPQLQQLRLLLLRLLLLSWAWVVLRAVDDLVLQVLCCVCCEWGCGEEEAGEGGDGCLMKEGEVGVWGD